MVVHLQYALIALAAVVTPIRLALHASLAHAHTTIVLSFDWDHLVTTAVHYLLWTRCHAYQMVILFIVKLLSVLLII